MASAAMITTQHGNVQLTDLRAALEHNSLHTIRLMLRLGLLGEAAVEFQTRKGSSAAQAGRQFVASMSQHSNPLVACMAQFEAALLKTREGSPARYGIEWDRNPNDVFHALESGGKFPPSEGMPCYFLEVAADIAGMVCCTRYA